MRKLSLIAALLFATAPLSASAQFTGPRMHDDFLDTSILRPPAGDKVAIIVFEDLGCPMCARAHPIELQVSQQLHVPIVRYDFPLAYHIWTFDGAVCARYLQDKVSPKLADQFRSDVFASQSLIENKDDLKQYENHWAQNHGIKLPAVLDPGGKLAAEVQHDYDTGQRLHVMQTPTIVVVSRNNYQVVCGTRELLDPNQLYPVVKAALAQAPPNPAPASTKSHASVAGKKH